MVRVVTTKNRTEQCASRACYKSCYKNSRIFFEFVAVVHVFMCGGPLRYENYRVTVNEVCTLV